MQKYGLLGYPLGHSFSKTYFNQKFEAEKIDAEYLNFEIPSIKEIKNVIKENPELNGLNVTIPYKEQVIPYLDDLDDDARQIGAVNVIKFTKGLFGKLKLKGYNSDIIGFKQSIDPLLKETHRKALILGTGGASKAVFHGLKQLGVGATLVSRKPKEFCITYDEITPKTMEQYTVIVNTTPLGMFPNIDSCPDIPYDLLTPNHLHEERKRKRRRREKWSGNASITGFRRLGDLAEIDRTISFQPHDLMKLASLVNEVNFTSV